MPRQPRTDIHSADNANVTSPERQHSLIMNDHETSLSASLPPINVDSKTDEKESTTAAKQQQTSDKFNDVDADVTIVSSDGVLFRVHSYYLKVHSSTFRSMLSLANDPCQRDRIELNDEVIEHSMVLEKLLEIMVDGEIDFEQDAQLGVCVVRLARKWDFATVLKTIQQGIRLLLLDADDAGFYVVLDVAVELRDYKAFASLIRKWGNRKWSEGELPTYRSSALAGESAYFDEPGQLLGSDKARAMLGKSPFEPGAMPIGHYLAIPPVIHWAMARATLLAEEESGKTPNFALIGDKFEELMAVAFPPDAKCQKRKAEDDIDQSQT